MTSIRYMLLSVIFAGCAVTLAQDATCDRLIAHPAIVAVPIGTPFDEFKARFPNAKRAAEDGPRRLWTLPKDLETEFGERTYFIFDTRTPTWECVGILWSPTGLTPAPIRPIVEAWDLGWGQQSVQRRSMIEDDREGMKADRFALLLENLDLLELIDSVISPRLRLRWQGQMFTRWAREDCDLTLELADGAFANSSRQIVSRAFAILYRTSAFDWSDPWAIR